MLESSGSRAYILDRLLLFLVSLQYIEEALVYFWLLDEPSLNLVDVRNRMTVVASAT